MKRMDILNVSGFSVSYAEVRQFRILLVQFQALQWRFVYEHSRTAAPPIVTRYYR
ncbi:hypothetical protein SK128_013287 [Halocaridina rubra]|uniref:Uncharacterized protein n=1 Tax=Halocaridina rubra TaxID=373956 RepID=A0AAN8XTV7_HALRR